MTCAFQKLRVVIRDIKIPKKAEKIEVKAERLSMHLLGKLNKCQTYCLTAKIALLL